MSYAIDRRLDFIDLRLLMHGTIRREHIVSTFGVSQPQASSDIGAFLEQYPGALDYDKSAKQYVVAKTPYRSRRKWTADAIRAWKQFSQTGHPMGWRD